MHHYRYIFCSMLLLAFFWAIQKPTELEIYQHQKLNHYTPSNTIIAFDIHDVITKKYIVPILKTAYRYPHKWKMIRSCSWHLLGKTLSCLWKKQWNRMRKLFREENSYLFEFMHQVADTQYPINGTVTIINQLKKMGYELHILSNISSSAYTSFKCKFAEIFNLFDVEQLSEWDGDVVIEKPGTDYFKNYLKRHNPSSKNIIFIDDQKINIDAAQEFGIIGIRFRSANQLNEQLISQGILPRKDHTTKN